MEETGVWRGMARNATGRGPRCMMSEPRSFSSRARGSRERDCSGKDVSTLLPGGGYSLASVSRAFLRVPRRPLASLPRLFPHQPTHRVKRPRRLRLSLSLGSPGLRRFPPPPPERRARLPGLRDDRRRPPRGAERRVRVVHPTRPRRFGACTPLRVALAPVPPLRVARAHDALFTTDAASADPAAEARAAPRRTRSTTSGDR